MRPPCDIVTAGHVASEAFQLKDFFQTLVGMNEVPDEMEEEFVNRVEEGIVAHHPIIELPVIHTFTDGMYGREATLPAGTILTTRRHLFDHQFVVADGLVTIWSAKTGLIMIRGPYFGVTRAGTRRVIYAHEHCRWKTFHPNPDNCQDPEEMVRRLTTRPDNPYIPKELQ